MSYTVEKLEDEPIVMTILGKDFDYTTEAEQSTNEAIAMLDEVSEPVYYITDISAVKFNLDQSIQGSSMAARGDNTLFHHPNVKQVLMVVGDKMQELSAAGMQSETYGKVNIRTFSNREDALAHARSE